MPNDIPDWTGQHQAQLQGGVSLKFLGDVGAPSLAIDAATETITAGGGPVGGGVMASFKAAAASTIARVGALGAFLYGSATSVSPLFGQTTTAGNLLVAWVTGSASGTEPTTTATGWVKVKSVLVNGGWCAIWARPNCGSAETAPTFTGGAAGASLMSAQLAEFSGAATSSPADQASSANAVGNAIAFVNSAADVAFGDLVMTATKWSNVAPAVSFSNAFNNGAAAVQAGNGVDSTSGTKAQNNAYGIIPPGTTSLPVGVQAWPYDSVGISAPTTGSKASVVLAATPGKTYTAATIAASLAATSAAAQQPDLQLLDGASVLWQELMSVQAVNGATDKVGLSGLAYKGTTGNSMTLAFSSVAAGASQRVNIGAYLR